MVLMKDYLVVFLGYYKLWIIYYKSIAQKFGLYRNQYPFFNA